MEYLGNFHIDIFAAAALGAAALWIRLKYGASFQQGVERMVDEIIDDFRPRMLFKMAVFILLGSTMSIILVGPATLRQAMAAGMSWTALLSGMATTRSSPSAKNANLNKGR